MNAKSLIGGILAGAAIGVAIGMLLAPSSGAKTRGKIAKAARDLGDSLKETAGNSVHALKEKFNSKVDETAQRGREALTSASEKIRI